MQIYKLNITYYNLITFALKKPIMHNRTGILVLLISLIIGNGCLQKESSQKGEVETDFTVNIKGILEDGRGQMVVLEEMAAREFIPLDTTFCDDSGAFEISISPIEVAFYVLRYGSSGYITLLLEPGEFLKFSGHFDHIDAYEIKGSKGSVLLQSLSIRHKQALEELGEITRKNMTQVSSPDYHRIKPGFDKQFDSIATDFHSYSTQFIHENSSSLAILIALYNLYGQGLPVFYPDKDLEIYQFVDSALMSNYDGIEAVNLLNAQVAEAMRQLDDDDISNRPQKGEIAPDFVSSRSDGSQLALSDLKGKFVLLSFWAGWSQTSRVENSFLKKAKRAYGEYPFQIFQVSFDDNQKIWSQAIHKDGLDWDHVSDLNRWDSPIADLYQIEKIPSNVLIDPEGKIVDIDIFGNKLLEKLEIIFRK